MDIFIESKAIFQSSLEKILISTVASMIAASIVIFIFYPLENLEARMQLGIIEKSNIFHSLVTIPRNTLYTGCLSSVIGHVLA